MKGPYEVALLPSYYLHTSAAGRSVFCWPVHTLSAIHGLVATLCEERHRVTPGDAKCEYKCDESLIAQKAKSDYLEQVEAFYRGHGNTDFAVRLSKRRNCVEFAPSGRWAGNFIRAYVHDDDLIRLVFPKRCMALKFSETLIVDFLKKNGVNASNSATAFAYTLLPLLADGIFLHGGDIVSQSNFNRVRCWLGTPLFGTSELRKRQQATYLEMRIPDAGQNVAWKQHHCSFPYAMVNRTGPPPNYECIRGAERSPRVWIPEVMSYLEYLPANVRRWYLRWLEHSRLG